jgi:nitrite reductase/ring-hydroxylating ferredoxin subunit
LAAREGSTLQENAPPNDWLRLCGLLDLPARGGRLFRDALGSGLDLLVFRLEHNQIVAYEARCPHARALLRPENALDHRLVCFLHVWEFDLRDGACLTAPGHPLRPFPVKIEGLDVFLSLGAHTPAHLPPSQAQGTPSPLRLRVPQDPPT